VYVWRMRVSEAVRGHCVSEECVSQCECAVFAVCYDSVCECMWRMRVSEALQRHCVSEECMPLMYV
jgi:hypothetical protein